MRHTWTETAWRRSTGADRCAVVKRFFLLCWVLAWPAHLLPAEQRLVRVGVYDNPPAVYHAPGGGYIDRHLRVLKQDQASIYHAAIGQFLDTREIHRIPARIIWTLIGMLVFSLSIIIAVLYAQIRTKVRMERTLRESEARYRGVVEDQTEVISRFRADGTFTFVNDVYCRFFGKSKDALIGQRWHPVAVADDIPEIEARLATLSPSNPVVVIENRVYSGNGDVRWMQFINRALFDDQGVLQDIQAVGRDITDRKAMEAALRESEARYRLLFDSGNDAIFVHHIREDRMPGHFIEVNEVACRSVGYARAELLTMTPEDINVAADVADFPRVIERLLTDKHMLFERMRITSAGRTFPVEVNSHLFELRGRPTVLSIARDITDRKLAEEKLCAYTAQLEAANRELTRAREAADIAHQAKNEFIANISHELRTPMNSILGFAQVLQIQPDLAAEHVERVKMIIESGDHLLLIINDLIDLSSLEAGKLPIRSEEFYLAPFSKSMTRMFALQARQKALDFRTEYDVELPEMLTGDRRRLRQILLNLLGNAVKFTHQGHVLFRVQKLAQSSDSVATIRFEVADSGVGIAPEQVRKIFDAFYQVGNKLLAETTGVGLGLTVSQRLAHMMGSHVQVSSTPGAGSTFWFDLRCPLRAENIQDDRRDTAEHDGDLSEAAPALSLPSFDDLTELLEFTLLGDIAAIKQRNAQLALSTPALEAFARNVSRFTGRFEMDKLGHFLERCLRHTPAD